MPVLHCICLLLTQSGHRSPIPNIILNRYDALSRLGGHMRRRDFISLLGGATVAWPRTLVAQNTGRARRIGVLMELGAGDPQAQSHVAALQQGLDKLGWSPGGNLAIDYRWAPDDAVLIWKSAKELVALRPDVIVAHSSPAVRTLRGETRNIPIVFVSISDPIGEDL